MTHPRLPEVDAADELAHDQDVDALNNLTLQRGAVRELLRHDRGAQVGEGVEAGAQREQAALGALLRGEGVPLVAVSNCAREA